MLEDHHQEMVMLLADNVGFHHWKWGYNADIINYGLFVGLCRNEITWLTIGFKPQAEHIYG